MADKGVFRTSAFGGFNKKDVLKSEEYGIPFAFYKNIYKRSFILEHSIEFPNLLFGEDPLFLTKALINVNEIYVLGTDLYGYNHSIGGGLNMKIDTLDKKQDYIQHFIDTFEILENNGFDEILNLYSLSSCLKVNSFSNVSLSPVTIISTPYSLIACTTPSTLDLGALSPPIPSTTIFIM